MRILLINPESNDKRNNCEAMGLEYIGAAILNEGVNVTIIDLSHGNDIKDIYETIFLDDISVVGITVNSSSYLNALYLAHIIKEVAPGVKVGFGGHLATFGYNDMLKGNFQIDFACIGEGEDTWAAISSMLIKEGRVNWDLVPKIVYRNTPGQIIPTQRTRFDPNKLPIPYRYLDSKNIVYSIVTTRGCAFECSFCGLNVDKRHRWKCRKIKNVADELRILVNEKGISELCINDADFFTSREHASQIIRIISNYPQIKKVYASSRIDTLGRAMDLLREFLESTSLVLELGMESGSTEQLKRYNKKEDIDLIRRVITEAKKLQGKGLSIHLDLILFDPFVSVEDITSTIKLLREIDLCNVYNEPGLFSSMKLIPFTAMRERTVSAGLAAENNYYNPHWNFKHKDAAIIYSYMKLYEVLCLPQIFKMRRTISEKLSCGSCSMNEKMRNLKIMMKLKRISYDYLEELIEAISSEKDLRKVLEKYFNTVADISREIAIPEEILRETD